MQLSIQTSVPGQDPGFLSAELGDGSTISDLKTFLIGSVELPPGFPEFNWILRKDGRVISVSDNLTLAQAGLNNSDFLEAVAQPKTAPRQAAVPSRQATSAPSGPGDDGKLEELRQHILSHAQTRSAVESRAAELLQPGETFDSVLNNPQLFKSRWQAMEDRHRKEAEDQVQKDMALNNDLSSDAQAQIYKRIQQQQVQNEANEIMETNPEMFGTVTMLYIPLELNGHPVKAFVDSGAQMTVISPQLVEQCNLSHRIDERYSGLARGVGTAKILGRIHRTPMKIEDPAAQGGFEELPCSLTVMEGKGVDLLFGLDMLKRFRCSIDLFNNCLAFENGMKIPFLSEGEIPKNEFDADGQTTTGSNNPTSNPPNVTAQPGPSKFAGAGRTLGSRPAPSIASSSSSTKVPSSGSSQTTLAPPPDRTPQPQPEERRLNDPFHPDAMRASRNSNIYGDDKVNIIIENGGVSRDQAVELLIASGGNVEMAMQILFDAP